MQVKNKSSVTLRAGSKFVVHKLNFFSIPRPVTRKLKISMTFFEEHFLIPGYFALTAVSDSVVKKKNYSHIRILFNVEKLISNKITVLYNFILNWRCKCKLEIDKCKDKYITQQNHFRIKKYSGDNKQQF